MFPIYRMGQTYTGFKRHYRSYWLMLTDFRNPWSLCLQKTLKELRKFRWGFSWWAQVYNSYMFMPKWAASCVHLLYHFSLFNVSKDFLKTQVCLNLIWVFALLIFIGYDAAIFFMSSGVSSHSGLSYLSQATSSALFRYFSFDLSLLLFTHEFSSN